MNDNLQYYQPMPEYCVFPQRLPEEDTVFPPTPEPAERGEQ